MPPANTSFLLASNIASLPFDFTQTDINDGGINFTVYYKFIAPSSAIAIGALGDSTGYNNNIKLYLGPASSPTIIHPPSTVAGVPIVFKVTPGTEYFLEFQKQSDTPGPCTLHVIVRVAPNLSTPVGSIMSPLPANGLPFPQQDTQPMAIISAVANNVTFKLTPPVVSDCYTGDTLSNGIFILSDNSGDANKAVVYNRDFSVLSTLTFPSGLIAARKCIGLGKFYCLTNASPPILRDVLSTGAFGSVNMTLTGLGFAGSGAVSNDGTLLYYHRLSVRGEGIRTWDLVNNVGLGVFAAGIADYVVDDIMVLSNGNVVASFTDTTFNPIIRCYTPAGALISSIAIGAIDVFSHHAHLAQAIDEPTFFWSKHETSVAGQTISHFKKWTVATGVAAVSLDYSYVYSEGFANSVPVTGVLEFGPGFGTPFMLLASTLYKGVYVFEPNKTSDTVNNNGTLLDVAIPNPTFRTGLLG